MRQNKTKQLLDYWLTLFRECNGSEGNLKAPNWPDRSRIQPAHCRSLLSDMFILESSGEAYRYRLAGTKLCALYGREMKHEKFSDAYVESDRKSAENWVSRLAFEDHVILICSIAESRTGEIINLETLLLPLSNSNGTGQRLLGITVPNDTNNLTSNGIVSTQTIRSVRVLRPWENQPVRELDSNDLQSQFRSPHLSGRMGMEAPPLFSPTNDMQTPLDSSDSDHPYRRVGHLMVIDGGKSQG